MNHRNIHWSKIYLNGVESLHQEGRYLHCSWKAYREYVLIVTSPEYSQWRSCRCASSRHNKQVSLSWFDITLLTARTSAEALKLKGNWIDISVKVEVLGNKMSPIQVTRITKTCLGDTSITPELLLNYWNKLTTSKMKKKLIWVLDQISAISTLSLKIQFSFESVLADLWHSISMFFFFFLIFWSVDRH